MPLIFCNSTRKTALFFIMLALFMPPARGAEARALPPLLPLTFQGIYHFTYGGIPFGKGGVEISQSAERYQMTADIASTGIVNAFLHHSSHSTATGTGSGFRYPHVRYESQYQTRKKKKYAMLRYENGALAEEKVAPPDNRSSRPAVSRELKDRAVNPLSLILDMRQSLHDAMRDGSQAFSLLLYDGRRLTQVHFRLAGVRTIPIGKALTEVVQVDVSRRLLEGFTSSELADAQKKKDPPLHVYFTHDERLLPLLFEAPLWFGTVRAVLGRECGEGESCLF